MDILQFFYENDPRVLEQNEYAHNNFTNVGHAVEWGGVAMEAAISSHRTDIVWCLKANVPYTNYDWDAALESAIKCGEIVVAEWLLTQGAQWPGFAGRAVVAVTVAHKGRLDVLQWLDTKGQLEGILGLVICAAEKGYIGLARWAIDRVAQDIEGSHWLTGPGGEASLAIHIAATNGHLDVAKYRRTHVQTPLNARQRVLEVEVRNWLREYLRIPEFTSWDNLLPVSGDTMMLAAGKGHLDVVKWLFEEYGDDRAVDIFSQGKKERGQESTTGSPFAMDAAASNGHLAVLKYLHKLEISTNNDSKKRKRGKAGMMEEVKCFDTPICTKRAMDDAAASGHQAILQWLHRNRTEGCTSLDWDMAAADGHLEVLKWLHGHRPGNCTHVAWDIAAARGHLGVLKWLHEHQLGNCTTTAMDRAAQAGKLDVVQWLHANTSAGCTTKAMDGAAGNRHLDVAKWLHAHRTEGCTAYAIDMASDQGDLAIVKWLHFNRTKGYALQALNTAVLGGHLDVVKWLLTHPVAVNV